MSFQKQVVRCSSGAATADAADMAQLSPPATPRRINIQPENSTSPKSKANNDLNATSISKTATPPGTASDPSNSGTKTSNTMPSMANSENMSNVISTMPHQQEFSYPPLGEMGMQDVPQPYLAEHRDYPQMGDDARQYEQQDHSQHQHQHEHQHHDNMPQGPVRYPSPPQADLYDGAAMTANMAAHHTAQLVNELERAMGEPQDDMKMDGEQEHGEQPESPGRSKPVPKPDRPITKDANGRFVCDWPGCEEPVKDFNRKCEWSKHMDKHDRPYKCPAEGCEKLPGFTYSGGLLRHEREVHNKHGGPRKLLNCPHENCKRHTGKGFSRMENLNEHLRRVHTGVGGLADGQNEMGAPTAEEALQGSPGQKRKRKSNASSVANGDGDEELKLDNKRLKTENEELRMQASELLAQIQAFRNGHAFFQPQAMQQQVPAQAAMQHPMPQTMQQQPQMQQVQMPQQQMQQAPMQQVPMHSPPMQQSPMQQHQQMQQVQHQQQQQQPHVPQQGQQQPQQQQMQNRMPPAPMM